MDEIAQKAYAAYSKTTNNKNFLGKQMPKWESLPDNIKQAWKNACTEAILTALNYMKEVVEDED